MRRFVSVSCLLCLGFFAPIEARHPVAEMAVLQQLLRDAWEHNGYEDVIRLEERCPGAFPVFRLLAEKGDVDLVVLAGNSGRTLALGPGYLGTSALPGKRGNTVIAGRRDTHFRFLSGLAVDDSIVIETLSGDKHLYRVIGLDVVDARRSSVVLDTPRSMLTLVTGYPFDPAEPGDRQRFVVTAKMLF
ncbi:MAG: class D sortase [Pseudomonadota bacterium]